MSIDPKKERISKLVQRWKEEVLPHAYHNFFTQDLDGLDKNIHGVFTSSTVLESINIDLFRPVTVEAVVKDDPSADVQDTISDNKEINKDALGYEDPLSILKNLNIQFQAAESGKIDPKILKDAYTILDDMIDYHHYTSAKIKKWLDKPADDKLESVRKRLDSIAALEMLQGEIRASDEDLADMQKRLAGEKHTQVPADVLAKETSVKQKEFECHEGNILVLKQVMGLVAGLAKDLGVSLPTQNNKPYR
ncbi:MAG: hypothetical protein ACK502_05935 [Alphaproteobacteria bacterium]